MRKSLALFAVLALVGVGMSLAATKAYKVKVDNMHCEKCAGAIDKALQKLESVKMVDTNLETKEVVIQLDDAKVTLDAVKEAIGEAGYKVSKVEEVKEKENTR